MADPRWPAYLAALEKRRSALYKQLTTHTLDHAAMCRLAGELRGIDYAIGTPPDLSVSDPRSET